MDGVQTKYMGEIKNGKPDGEWSCWYEDGSSKSKGAYKDGEEDGVFSVWYNNGQKKKLKTVSYSNVLRKN